MKVLCVALLAAVTLMAAPHAALAPAAKDLTGKWNFAVETSAGSGAPVINLKQDGEKLTGDYQGQLGAAKLTGTVKDGKFEFKFTVDQLGEVNYSGELLDDGTVKGKVKLGEMGEGTFTGKRADK
jgi:hypothetical protein